MPAFLAPLALTTGIGPRLIWAALLLMLLWALVAWALG
jgi:hypothetical protein